MTDLFEKCIVEVSYLEEAKMTDLFEKCIVEVSYLEEAKMTDQSPSTLSPIVQNKPGNNPARDIPVVVNLLKQLQYIFMVKSLSHQMSQTIRCPHIADPD